MYIYLIISIISTVLAQILLKKGMMIAGKIEYSFIGLWDLFLNIFQNIYLFFGLIFLGTAFVSWLFVLSEKQLSLAYPISSSVAISLTVLFSVLLFKDAIFIQQAIGICLIILGVFLLLIKF